MLAGACSLKLHEDWGTTPAAIDCCLSVADDYDVQVMIHTDTLNEVRLRRGHRSPPSRAAPSTPSTPRAPAAAMRPTSSRSAACRTSSRPRPTRRGPTRVNTLDEHLDMLMVCHHLSPSIPEDVAFAESRIRKETIAAEDILHDLGAFSIISSDSQAMGRVGEVIIRTWQTAAQDEACSAAACPRRPATTTISASAATSPNTPSTRRSRTALSQRYRLDRGRQARRPRAVEPGLLRREARHGADRRHRSPRRRWATPTPRSRRRSRCTTGRCSAPTARRCTNSSVTFVSPGGARSRHREAARRRTSSSSRSRTPAAASASAR